MSTWMDRLGRVGVWTSDLRNEDHAGAAAAAAELASLGYKTLWTPGGAGGDVMADVERALDAAPGAVIATGILNIWRHEPADVGRWWRGLGEARQARVMLGLGISHSLLIGDAYAKPVATMSAYLDKLDAEGVQKDRRCLAALAPRMLQLAATRTAGSHPYLTTPEHTAQARAAMGPGALLAPEQGVILETDPARAREKGAASLALYMRLPNYVNNWRRLGFSEEDVTTPSDKLVDAIFAWGTPQQIKARIDEHVAAGADHVCIQVISGERLPGGDLAGLRAACRELAPVLL